MQKRFADISGFQPSIDWHMYRTFSDMVAIKTSEGIGFRDPIFASHRSGAIAAGIETIWYYHFGRPEFGNAPQAEARYFQSVAGPIRQADRVILDIETGSHTAQWALAFMQELATFYPNQVGVYSYASYVTDNLQNPALAQYPLWFALYNPNQPATPAPWKQLVAWQFSDAFQVPGIGICDCSVLLEELSMTIDITTPGVSTFFKQDSGGAWICLKNGNTIHGGILAFYQSVGPGLCGLTNLGLPESNEIPMHVSGHPEIVEQQFERARLRYDPSHIMDNPPGSGAVYLTHHSADASQIQAELDAAQQKLAQIKQLAS